MMVHLFLTMITAFLILWFCIFLHYMSSLFFFLRCSCFGWGRPSFLWKKKSFSWITSIVVCTSYKFFPLQISFIPVLDGKLIYRFTKDMQWLRHITQSTLHTYAIVTLLNIPASYIWVYKAFPITCIYGLSVLEVWIM